MSERIMDDAAPASMVELGQKLAALRNARGWSLDDVAQKLHLPSNRILGLESGNGGSESPVYLKGFFKSYARFVDMPEAWVDEVLRVAAAEPELKPAAGAVARRVSWIERYKWAGTYAVGTALALTAVNWLVSNTPQLGVPDAPRVPVAVQVPAPDAPEIEPASATTTPPAPDSMPEPPMIASLNPFPSRESARETPAAPQSSLLLSFQQDSWVEVVDAGGERLLYSVVSAGEKRSFDGALSVRIGNVRGVSVEVDGKLLDMTEFTRGNVARFDVTQASDSGWRARPRGAGSESSDG